MTPCHPKVLVLIWRSLCCLLHVDLENIGHHCLSISLLWYVSPLDSTSAGGVCTVFSWPVGDPESCGC